MKIHNHICIADKIEIYGKKKELRTVAVLKLITVMVLDDLKQCKKMFPKTLGKYAMNHS